MIRVVPILLKGFKLLLNKVLIISQLAFKNLSQIGLDYRTSKLSMQDHSTFFRYSSVRPGDRVPYNRLRNEFTEGINLHLLLFSKIKLEETIFAEFAEVCALYPELIKIHEVAFSSDTRSIYKQFGIKTEGFYLIRPDSYIGYGSKTLNSEKLKSYLQIYLKERTTN